jgi:hypothetical protein
VSTHEFVTAHAGAFAKNLCKTHQSLKLPAMVNQSLCIESDGMKTQHSIGYVKLAALQLELQRTKRLLKKTAQEDCSRRLLKKTAQEAFLDLIRIH